jgi:hypothetical protein
MRPRYRNAIVKSKGVSMKKLSILSLAVVLFAGSALTVFAQGASTDSTTKKTKKKKRKGKKGKKSTDAVKTGN